MSWLKFTLSGAALGVLSWMFASAVALAAPPSVEAFGQLPSISEVELSPDGTHFVAVQAYQGREILVIYDMNGPPGKNFQVMSLDVDPELEESLRFVHWVNDNRLVASLEFRVERDGIPLVETRMFGFDNDFGNNHQLPKRKKKEKSARGLYYTSVAQFQDNIIDWLPNDSDHVLIALDKEGESRTLNLYKMNVYNGLTSKQVKGKDKVYWYMTDAQHEPRLRWVGHDDFHHIYHRKSSGDEWQRLFERSDDDGWQYVPLKFSNDPNQLYVQAISDIGRDAIFLFDVAEQKISKTIMSDPKYDVDGLLHDSVSRKIIGAQYTGARGLERIYWDPVYAEVQRKMEAQFSGKNVHITSADKTQNKFSIFVTSPTEPGVYYIYTRSQPGLQEVGRAYAGLKNAKLRPQEPLSFTARDGREIPAYLTLPEGSGPYPMVVMPHGGPTSRISWSFDYWAQFLSSRGYAVLQPNFRGSSGYGSDFETAGDDEWGLAMQDDITDGVKAMIEQGIADPNRIAIVGGSYGGYAALMGAVKTPDLYRCAVAYAPVTDLPKFISERAVYKFSDRNIPGLGHKGEDKERLKTTSPINNVDKINIPILLVHGDKDRTVDVSHSEKMASKLKRKNKAVKLIVQEEGDHGPSLGQHRIELLREMEAFLAAHMR